MMSSIIQSRQRNGATSLGLAALIVATSAAWADPDFSTVGPAFDLRSITSGRAPAINVFTFSIVDSGAQDRFPTILESITIHGDVTEQGTFSGQDFIWELLSSDIDGQGSDAVFPSESVSAGSVFSITFGDDRALLHVPDGESRTLSLRARYMGNVSGQLPNLITGGSSQPRTRFTADLDNGDFITSSELDSSLLNKGAEGPELNVAVQVTKPLLRLVDPLPSVVSTGEKLSAIVQLVDTQDQLLEDLTETVTLLARRTAIGFAPQIVGESVGPINGEFHFVENGQDQRLDFSNPEAYPAGAILFGFGDSEGTERIFNLNRPLTVLADDDSVINQFAPIESFESGAGFQPVWSLALVDSGSSDGLPTIVTRLVIDVAIGDGCIFDATDFNWRLASGGMSFDAVEVTPDRVVLQSSDGIPAGITVSTVPVEYTRENLQADVLVIAQDGALGAFQIEAASNQRNAAFAGQSIALRLDISNIEYFRYTRDSSSSNVARGSQLAPTPAIETVSPTLVQVATPFFPPLECENPIEGEGEGEGEGIVEGEGEGQFEEAPHSSDQNGDGIISLSELLRVIQFFNSAGYHCVVAPQTSEDGFLPSVNGAAQSCTPHASDYNPQNWVISLSELLRLIQFFNSGGYTPCESGEDGFCPAIQ